MAAAAALQEQPAEVLLDLDARLELADLQRRRVAGRVADRADQDLRMVQVAAVDEQAHQPRQVRLQDARHRLHASRSRRTARPRRGSRGASRCRATRGPSRRSGSIFSWTRRSTSPWRTAWSCSKASRPVRARQPRPVPVLVVRPSCAAHNGLLGRAKGRRMRHHDTYPMHVLCVESTLWWNNFGATPDLPRSRRGGYAEPFGETAFVPPEGCAMSMRPCAIGLALALGFLLSSNGSICPGGRSAEGRRGLEGPLRRQIAGRLEVVPTSTARARSTSRTGRSSWTRGRS